mgnify:CR=1 FL=1
MGAASSVGGGGDENGDWFVLCRRRRRRKRGVLRRSQAGSLLSLRYELGNAKVSNGCAGYRGVDRSRRCGSARSYGGAIFRRTAADVGAPGEMRFALARACGNREDRGGDAGLPWVFCLHTAARERSRWTRSTSSGRVRPQVRGRRGAPLARGNRGTGARGGSDQVRVGHGRRVPLRVDRWAGRRKAAGPRLACWAAVRSCAVLRLPFLF